VEPKGRLRLKNDRRYDLHEEKITSANENNHRDEDDEANDEENHRLVRNDAYDENNMVREGNPESESADAEIEDEDNDNDKSEGVRHRGPEYETDHNAADYVGQPRNSESESVHSKLKEEEADNHNDNIKRMEPPSIFHILETRFMQNQPNLVQLAKARLQLFKAICLPTVVQQTAWGNFLWIIRTDPDLHIDIRQELVEILNERGALTTKQNGTNGIEERALTYVIGSNDNYIVANSTTVNPQIQPFDIHDMFSNMLSKPDKIFAGKIENIKSTLDGLSSEEKDVVMWTRLDADDGLSVEFMKYIQDQIVRYFVPEKATNVKVDANKEKEQEIEKEEEALIDFGSSDSEDQDSTGVRARVDDDDNLELSKLTKDTGNSEKATTEVEESEDDDEDRKSLPYSPPHWMYWCGGQNIDWFLTDPIHDPKHETGVVYPVLHANVCVTPGITVAIRGDIMPALVPKLDHDKIVSYLSDVGGGACNRTGVQDDDEVPDEGKCFQMMHWWTHAVRSRTPTSAGMMGVNPDENQLQMVKRTKHLKKLMWRQMHKDFLLKDDDLRTTNSYFAEHVYDIAEENARGQCTNGHSCKTSSKDRLQQYVDLRGETDGGVDVVDGILVRPTTTR